MINLRGKLCWSKIRICFLSLCIVLMGNEIWDLNDLTVRKTVLLLTAQEFQTEQREKNINLSKGFEPLDI